MKTVGELLKQKRLEKKLTRNKIVKKTKISSNYVKALENDDFANLPEAAFVKGFIRNYAKVVGLQPKQALAVFRRDYDQNVKGQIVPRSLTSSVGSKRAIWTPKTTAITLIAIVVLSLIAYFVYQLRLLTAAPPLEIFSPQENEHVVSTITVSGKTDPQATLKLNNQLVLIDENGEFSQSLLLSQGTRTITIESTSRSGKTRTIQRTVQVEQ